ncbi:MAG: FAD-dependent oxidoreductase [Myxococcaceae bacterium]|jgi:photolyase PhrII|nr:FAD-dependent oxidoreductase [Myxococcaceae bacterium]
MSPVLPPQLAERVQPGAPPPREGRYVVYWTRIAARATENPALDVALSMAKHLRLPCFVYHALSERYRYASDRLHTFILEGARDLQRDLAARGVGTVFHLQRAADRRPHLVTLARDAALVVTDFMPVQPLLRWDDEVARAAPLWRVDASCLAPLWAFPRPLTRAFEFRKAAQPLWNTRLTAPWVDVEPEAPPFVPDLESLDLSTADVPALVAGCDIDHSVAPVFHTRGGAGAGLARWAHFHDAGLGRYAKDRNDPLREGTSRISAYLHFGHLSPFRVARDCATHRTEGAEKFLDELLTWRELAWHFCWHHPAHEQVEVLPAWARETLHAHERDGREFLPSYEQLARAQTGHPLWDACQRSLLTHGELHNNVRMTWGKALLPWTRSAREALAWLIDLNHRYALDGRDPASYGGILWCLGALDRPFTPETKYFGSVRPRWPDEQARRFDVAEYERRMHRPSRGQPLVVAVVGAGVAGAAAARTLADAGHAVTVFDKGRGPGGRASTRREGEATFDHGAPCFQVTDERFARWARAWWQERVLAEWRPRVVTLGGTGTTGEAQRPSPEGGGEKPPVRLVATPGMNALLERMLRGLDVRFQTRVDGLSRREERFGLTGEGGHPLGEYDAVVVALPGPQAAALVDPLSYAYASRLREAVLAPTWAVMLGFAGSLGLDFDEAQVTVGPLGWLGREASKPERRPGERWVLHASTAWSQRHVDEAPEVVLPQLVDAFFATTGAARVSPTTAMAHRWRYAQVATPLGEPCALHESGRVVACGDWCLGPGLEAAWLSGLAAAGRLNGLGPSTPEAPAPASTRHPSQLRLV